MNSAFENPKKMSDSSLIRVILNECFFSDGDRYMNLIHESDERIVNRLILLSEQEMESLCRHLISLEKMSAGIGYLKSLPAETRFSVYPCLLLLMEKVLVTKEAFPAYQLDREYVRLMQQLFPYYLSLKTRFNHDGHGLWWHLMDLEYDMDVHSDSCTYPDI